MLTGVLLALLLGEIAWLFLRRPARPAASRRARYARSIRNAYLHFGVTAVAVLALTGRLGALLAMPGEFAPAADRLGAAPGDPRLVAIYVGGLTVGMVASNAISWWRRGRPSRWFPDVAWLYAREGETGIVKVLAIAAGVTEEPFFRVALPLLIARVTGSATIAFAAAAVLFGLCHRYQGWKGIVLTTLSGAVLSVIYLQTGSLAFAIAVHAAIDFNILVVRPAILRHFGRRAD